MKQYFKNNEMPSHYFRNKNSISLFLRCYLKIMRASTECLGDKNPYFCYSFHKEKLIYDVDLIPSEISHARILCCFLLIWIGGKKKGLLCSKAQPLCLEVTGQICYKYWTLLQISVKQNCPITHFINFFFTLTHFRSFNKF